MNSGIDSNALKKTDWVVIGTVWLITQMICLFFFGIVDTVEAITYISASKHWIEGDKIGQWSDVFYSGYVGVHVLIRLVGLTPKWMYLIQLLMSGLALFYFVKILLLCCTSRLAILFSAILYATCFLVQQWVCYLFTDSVFFCLLVISIYYLLVQQRSRREEIIFWVLLVIIPFFRPVGFLYVLLACVHFILNSASKNFTKLVGCLVYLSFMSIVIYKSLTQSGNYFYSLHNIDANIICGYPSSLLQYRNVPYREAMGIFSYVYDNPGMFMRLFLYRLFKVFSMTRPYYSNTHNLAISGCTIIYYILAIAGLLNIFSQRQKEKYFLFLGLVIFSIPSIIFCVDWSGRFSLPVFCFVLILAGVGVDFIVKNLKWRNRSTQ